jgi:hypothetical protein
MKRTVCKSIEEQLSKDHACYVLVTCDSPSKDGEMQVKMSYHGSPLLAAMLLEGASSAMENEVENNGENSEYIREIVDQK